MNIFGLNDTVYNYISEKVKQFNDSRSNTDEYVDVLFSLIDQKCARVGVTFHDRNVELVSIINDLNITEKQLNIELPYRVFTAILSNQVVYELCCRYHPTHEAFLQLKENIHWVSQLYRPVKLTDVRFIDNLLTNSDKPFVVNHLKHFNDFVGCETIYGRYESMGISKSDFIKYNYPTTRIPIDILIEYGVWDEYGLMYGILNCDIRHFASRDKYLETAIWIDRSKQRDKQVYFKNTNIPLILVLGKLQHMFPTTENGLVDLSIDPWEWLHTCVDSECVADVCSEILKEWENVND